MKYQVAIRTRIERAVSMLSQTSALYDALCEQQQRQVATTGSVSRDLSVQIIANSNKLTALVGYIDALQWVTGDKVIDPDGNVLSTSIKFNDETVKIIQ